MNDGSNEKDPFALEKSNGENRFTQYLLACSEPWQIYKVE